MEDPDDTFPLHAMISALRAQLQQSIDDAKQTKAKLLFDVEGIDLELKVVASQTAGVDGGIGWNIFKFGAKSEAKDELVSTLRLKLKPISPDGSPQPIAAEGRPNC